MHPKVEPPSTGRPNSPRSGVISPHLPERGNITIDPYDPNESDEKDPFRRIGKPSSHKTRDQVKATWQVALVLFVVGILFPPLWVVAIIVAIYAHSISP